MNNDDCIYQCREIPYEDIDGLIRRGRRLRSEAIHTAIARSVSVLRKAAEPLAARIGKHSRRVKRGSRAPDTVSLAPIVLSDYAIPRLRQAWNLPPRPEGERVRRRGEAA